MIKRSVMLCKSVCGFALLACLMAPGPGGSGNVNVWAITNPNKGDHFTATITSLGAAGTAATADSAYVTKIKQQSEVQQWTVMASAGGSSTSDTSAPTWGCTMTGPTGGFRVAPAHICLRSATSNQDDDFKIIYFD